MRSSGKKPVPSTVISRVMSTLARRRWASRSAKERQDHARKMAAARWKGHVKQCKPQTPKTGSPGTAIRVYGFADLRKHFWF